jgi:hypothetical protein
VFRDLYRSAARHDLESGHAPLAENTGRSRQRSVNAQAVRYFKKMIAQPQRVVSSRVPMSHS